jgi:hypothetical protein
MSVSEYTRQQIIRVLEDRRVVVWYDGEQAFGGFVTSLPTPTLIISAAKSTLRARRDAEEAYRRLNEAESAAEAHANLLVYVPHPRPSGDEARRQDPFQAFALAGTAFGDKDGERLESLARQAMPERAEEISRLFAESRPTLALLDGLQSTQSWPLLQEALGTTAPVEVLAQFLCREDPARRVAAVPGALGELIRLAGETVGFGVGQSTHTVEKIRRDLGAYVLFSEFALDLPEPLPESLSGVSRAEPVHRNSIFAICHRMRSGADLRDGYVELARRVEEEFRLAQLTEAMPAFGNRDTFPFEERRYFRWLRDAVERADLEAARSIVDGRRSSLWKEQPDRTLVWAAVERCIDFLETAERVGDAWSSEAGNLRQMVRAYTREGGWSGLDRHQRLFEQSATACAGDPEINPLIELSRRRYREVALAIQDRFLAHFKAEGWPPEGVLRQTQIFDKHVAPLLEQRAKVAYFPTDSLRYEMGSDLAEALASLGTVETSHAANILPAATIYGMAALLPGVDGALRLARVDSDFLPAVGPRILKNSDARMDLLKERYGDRFADVVLDDLLSRPMDQFRSRLSSVDLLVVRTQDPDQIAESLGNWRARKYLSDVVGEMADVVRRLASLGFTHFVIAADHGHVLLSDIPPGDVVPKPAGEWAVSKRRCLLGRSLSPASGTLTIKAQQAGIQGDPEELCIPTGFKVFTAGDGYFHEGVSLQETIVPVVVAHLTGSVPAQGRREISIRYKSDRFTARVIGLKVTCSGLDFGEPVRVRIEAHDGSSAKASIVGEAADCEARDDRTHEIALQPGVETAVPLLISPDFSAPKVEIRATDPQTGVVWSRLELKNAMLD